MATKVAYRGNGQPAQAAQQRKPPPRKKRQTKQFRKWKGWNLTDARAAIDDDELAWCENAVTVGNGAIQILPGPGEPIATIAAGVSTLWGMTLNGVAITLSINADGSISQITIPTGAVTAVAPAGTVSGTGHDCHVFGPWQGTTALFIDPLKGYMSWDGTTFAVIDATQRGTNGVVFEGRVFLANNRTLTYTAPNTFNNFTTGDGAGATIITDEAFVGNVTGMLSALEELWITSSAAIEGLANVTATGVAPSVVTTFSITNIVSNLGTVAPHALLGYFRAIAFLAPFGAYAMSGVTPQKLSKPLDGLFPSITVDDEVPAAIAVLQNLPCLLLRVTYTGANPLNPDQAMQAGLPPQKMVIGFTEGKWFCLAQGNVAWMTTVVVSGNSEAWATDGSHIFKLCGAALTTPVAYKVQTKLFDFGLATTMKAAMKVGFEFHSLHSVNPTVTIDSELSSQVVTLNVVNTLEIINALGNVLQLENALNQPLTLVSQGTVLGRAQTSQFGHYLGFTISGNDPPYRIQALQIEYVETREWSSP